MKFVLAAAIILAVCIASSTAGGPDFEHGGPGRRPRLDIWDWVQRKAARNQTVADKFVEALNLAGLGTTAIVNNAVDYSYLNQHFFTAIPLLSNFFSTYITDNNPNAATLVTATINYIQSLPTTQTELNHLIGYLYIADKINFVSGNTNTQTVDFTSLQDDAEASAILLQFVQSNVREGLGNQGGPRWF